MKTKKTIGIMTNFQEFNLGYSLTGIVVDQALMLLDNGHKVVVFVNEHFNPKYNRDARLDYLLKKYGEENFVLTKKTKFMHLPDYQTQTTFSDEHKAQSAEAGWIYAEEVLKHDIDVVFTHDYIFTGWNLPYAVAVKKASKILDGAGKKVLWLHWIHSVPSPERKDWWELHSYGNNHHIVFPNSADVTRVCETFATNASRVRVIPHIKDIRTYYDFSEESWNFTKAYPDIMNAGVIQIYPVSTDRMAAKQLQLVIKIFGYIKKTNVPVFLCAANQWATGKQRKEDVEKYILLAEHCGLEYGKDFVFTSEISDYPELVDIVKQANGFDDLDNNLPENTTGKKAEIIDKINWEGDFSSERDLLLGRLQPYATGIARRMLREIQLLSSVFIFPTREESFGLVGPEAALSGALVVMNKSLVNQYEILGHNTLAFDFGSHHNNTEAINDEKYLKDIAHLVLNRIYMNEALMTKIFCRCRYNMDLIYNRYYVPFMA